MPKIFYLDSNVFISFVREEIDSSFNYLYLDAKNFFTFCAEGKHELMLSGWFFAEVRKIVSLRREDVIEDFERMKIKICFPKEGSQETAHKIAKKCGLHYADSLHVAIAFENKADAIITWNKKDMEKAGEFVECFTPSEISYILGQAYPALPGKDNP